MFLLTILRNASSYVLSPHSTRFAATCAHALDAPPLNCRPPSPVFSPRHAFAITHTAALRIRAPHAPRSLQSSHVPRCSAPDVLVFAHDPTHRRLRVPSTAVRAPDARTHTNPHVLDPTRPAVPRRALTPDYVRPPPLRPRPRTDLTRPIPHEPTRPRSHTSTRATVRTELSPHAPTHTPRTHATPTQLTPWRRCSTSHHVTQLA